MKKAKKYYAIQSSHLKYYAVKPSKYQPNYNVFNKNMLYDMWSTCTITDIHDQCTVQFLHNHLMKMF